MRKGTFKQLSEDFDPMVAELAHRRGRSVHLVLKQIEELRQTVSVSSGSVPSSSNLSDSDPSGSDPGGSDPGGAGEVILSRRVITTKIQKSFPRAKGLAIPSTHEVDSFLKKIKIAIDPNGEFWFVEDWRVTAIIREAGFRVIELSHVDRDPLRPQNPHHVLGVAVNPSQ